MERLFTEDQWRAIAAVECLTECRPEHDGFHFWCKRKRLVGPSFAGGEFYLGERPHAGMHPEFRVLERPSGADFAWSADPVAAIAEARLRINAIGDYLPILLKYYRKLNAADVAEWDRRRADMEAARPAAEAKRQAREAKKKVVGKRRKAIFDKSEGHCHYCKTELELTGDWHVEHKMPKALGGTNEPVNLVAACAPCNHAKKDKTDVEFFALLAGRVGNGAQPAAVCN